VLSVFLQICGRKKRDGTYHLPTEKLAPDLIDRFIGRRQSFRMYDGQTQDRNGRKIVRIRAVSNVTLRKELRYLSAFFNWCCRQRPPYLRENPIKLSNASSIKSDARPHYMVTEEEFRALLRVCETPRQYLFLLLGWWTGGRRSDAEGVVPRGGSLRALL
jgi:integrase